MTRDDYLTLRRPYEPEAPQLLIIAESPPVSGLYFYNPDGATSEPLFSALMQHLPFVPATKDEGLREFQRKGWLLVDATRQPVNKRPDKNKVILQDYPLLRGDIDALPGGRSTPLVLVKVNVCRLLGPKLTADGFRVLNREPICFPGYGNQPKFHRQLAAILNQTERDG